MSHVHEKLLDMRRRISNILIIEPAALTSSAALVEARIVNSEFSGSSPAATRFVLGKALYLKLAQMA